LTDIQHAEARKLHDRLQRQGIRTVLIGGHGGKAQLNFLLRADHDAEEIDSAIEAVVANLNREQAEQVRRKVHVWDFLF
jgi:hypothetical protein